MLSVPRTLHAVNASGFFLRVPEMDQATFCIVLRVPGMDCAALCDHCAIQFLPFSTWYSYTSILTQYGVIIETFFLYLYILYNFFCPLGLSAF